MTININGTTGISGVDGSAGTPAIQGSDTNTGVFFGTNTIDLSTDGISRLSIDSSGNLGIGTTSPDNKLHVFAGDSSGSSSAQAQFTIENSGNSGLQFLAGTSSVSEIRFGDSGDNGAGSIAYSHSDNSIRFGTNNGTEKVRIDSSGRLLVGLTSDTTNTTLSLQGRSDDSSGGPIVRFKRGEALPTDELSLGNIFFSDGQNRVGAEIQSTTEGNWSASSTPTRLGFFTTPSGSTSSVERMRINANGGFRAKSTTASYVNESAAHHEMVVTGNNNIMNIYHTDSTGTNCGGLFLKFTNAAPNGTGLAIRFDDSSAMRFLVRTNGGIANYQSNDSNLCDEREKKNIVDLDSTWDCLKQWELKKFHYNEDADTDDKRYGVIAQQVAQHCPEVIADWVKQDAAEAVLDNDGNVVTPAQEEIVRMGVKEQQMMWMAIKALQEAQTRIETLEARLSVLEGGAN